MTSKDVLSGRVEPWASLQRVTKLKRAYLNLKQCRNCVNGSPKQEDKHGAMASDFRCFYRLSFEIFMHAIQLLLTQIIMGHYRQAQRAKLYFN